jgi:polyhydroxyalkanoate synthesis regulator phasin
VDETTERLLQIVDEVFRAPAGDRGDGQNGPAGSTPTKARLRAITEMADSLIERGDLVREESDRLLELLAARVQDLDHAAQPTQRARQPRASTEEAVLHATKMAVTGSRRKEIADSLVEEFGVRDPHAIIESILGPAERR